MGTEWGQPLQHELIRSPSTLSDGWDYARPPPFEAKTLPRYLNRTESWMTFNDSHDLHDQPSSPSDDGETPGPRRTSFLGAAENWQDDFTEPNEHWALEVFDGRHPVTTFTGDSRFKPSICFGTNDNMSLASLSNYGYSQVFEMPFDRETIIVSLHHRPRGNGARILITENSRLRSSETHCVPLTSLKIIRRSSCLELCLVRRDGRYRTWAELCFHAYERMVLFYCTFVAMKYQDLHRPERPELLDDFRELQSGDDEVEEFGGITVHEGLLHALRLFTDRNSGAARLEASALRGPMKDLPIWTSFITRYSTDPDWMALEGGTVVSLAAVRPPPYVFVSGYNPPRNRHGEYILQFTTANDAKDLIATWTGLCRRRPDLQRNFSASSERYYE